MFEKRLNETKTEKAKRLAKTTFFAGWLAISTVIAADGLADLAKVNNGEGFLPHDEDAPIERVDEGRTENKDEYLQIMIGGLSAAEFGVFIALVNRRQEEEKVNE